MVFWDKKNKKQIFLQKRPDGKPLKTQDDCAGVLIILKESGYDPKIWGKDKSYQFDKALDTWFSLSTCSPKWLQQRKQIAKRFFTPFFQTKDIRLIKSMDINVFVSEIKKKDLSDKMIYNVVGELKAFFNFHKRSLPTPLDFPKNKVQASIPRGITSKEQDQIFEFIPEIDLPIFAMMRFYGCRSNESAGLLKENVFLDADKPHVVIATALGRKSGLKPTTKSRVARSLPIHNKLRWIFENRSDSRFQFTHKGIPYSNGVLVRIWNKANKLAHDKYKYPLD